MGKKSETVDRISELPELVIHHIMSFLRRKDFVRTSVLSKRWQRIGASFPILEFDQLYSFDEETKEVFFDHVDQSLSRFIEHKDLKIQKFRLVISLIDSRSFSLLDKWIRWVIDGHVEEIDLWFCTETCPLYNLPRAIFAAKSIKVLKLKDCNLGQRSCMESIKFKSLQKLFLDTIHVEEEVLHHVISSCPVIEELALVNCWGLRRIRLYGLHSLYKVSVIEPLNELGSIDINAPSLEYFRYEGENAPDIDLSACQNLKHLSLWNSFIEDGSFQGLESKFPLLENLDVITCKNLKNVKIPSHHLKRFILYDCKNLLTVDIDAPNLISLSYEGELCTSISSTSALGKWEATFNVLNLHFLELREFLSRSHQFEVLNLRVGYDQEWIVKNSCTLEKLVLQEISVHPAYELEHLKLEIQSLSTSYGTFVDDLFWTCHPQNLTIVLKDELNVHFAKYLCTILVRQEGLNCCNSSSVKCWRHYLKDATVEGYEGMEDERLNILLDTSAPTLSEDLEIHFKLKWGSDLCSYSSGS